MITDRDVKFEVKKAGDIILNDNIDTNTKIKLLYKLLQVTLKVLTGMRLNTVRIMEKLEIPKIEPRKRENENA
jgi:hypothetical protein